MVSNEERREVARKLRSLDEHIDGMPLMCTKQEHNAMALGAIRAVVGKGDIFHLLADLIDRPTCQMVECAIDHGSRSWGMRCTACGKEFEHMKPSYGWHNCPNCGAEVKR